MSAVASAVKLGAVAVGGYFLWEKVLKPMMATTTGTTVVGTTVVTTGGGAGTGSGGGGTVTPTSSVLQALYTKLQAVGGIRSPDQWNWYLMDANPSITAPDPLLVFPDLNGGNRDTYTLSLGDYWAKMQPYLRANLGLTGLRGVERGLRGLALYLDQGYVVPEWLPDAFSGPSVRRPAGW